jgi:hypothetical protein
MRQSSQLRPDAYARLTRLPGWWLGAATTRRQLARQAQEAGRDSEADAHLRLARAYERQAVAFALAR